MAPKIDTVTSFTKYFTDEVPEGAKEICLGIILGWMSKQHMEDVTSADDKTA